MGYDPTGNIRTKKAMLRKEMLEKRRAMSLSDRMEKSQKICDSFLTADIYADASVILLYKAYNNEVDTDRIFERALKDGKKIAYPLSKTEGGEPDLIFYLIEDLNDLCEGYKGILEPDTSKSLEVFDGQADICITPGAVFDSKCHRIGYGRAFYDRYIRLMKPKKVVGLAYRIQIADVFETEESDLPTDMVITETGIYNR